MGQSLTAERQELIQRLELAEDMDWSTFTMLNTRIRVIEQEINRLSGHNVFD
jgi:hypothetical protein